jgi:hypothetical protein
LLAAIGAVVGGVTPSAGADGLAGRSAWTSTARQIAQGAVVCLAPNFTASPTEGIAPLEVAFTDQTAGGVENRLWQFGDGQTSNLRSPAHLDETPSIYVAPMTVWDHGSGWAEPVEECIRVGFPDVPPGHWAFSPVLLCTEEGIVCGYPEGLYHPTYVVSREQMAVYISRALAGGDSNVPPGPASASFPNVAAEHWAYDYVECIRAEAIAEGCADCRYHPSDDCSRGQMAVFVERAFRLSRTTDKGDR